MPVPLKIERPSLPYAPRTVRDWMLTGKNPERAKRRAAAMWGRANRFRNEAFFAKTSEQLIAAAVRFLLAMRDMKPNPMTAFRAMSYAQSITGPMFQRVYVRLAEVTPRQDGGE